MTSGFGVWGRAALVCCALGASVALADESHAQGHSKDVLFDSPLADVPGKHLVVVNLEWDPKSGQHNIPHRHPGSVYVYVTKGAAKLGIEGQPVRVVHAGESFFEPPGALHTVAESASATEPAAAIAVLIVPDGAPLLTRDPPAAQASQAPSGQERAQAAGQGLVGSPAPKFVLTTIDGEKIDLGRLYGKQAVYLKFWATWCKPCREQMPHFEHAYETAGSDLAVIAINAGFDDSLEDVREFRRKVGIKMPIVIDDGRLGTAFNLRVTPEHVVIGRDGRIQYIGHLADERLESALTAARAAPVAVAAVTSSDKGSRADPTHHGVGDRLPDLSVDTLDGTTFKVLDPGAHRPTALVFMSPWCESYLAQSRPARAASCRQVREQVEQLAKDDPQVRWLAIASGLWATPVELSDYRAQYKTEMPVTLDESGKLFRSFRVMNVPTVMLADADGRITRRIEGFDANLPVQLQRLASR